MVSRHKDQEGEPRVWRGEREVGLQELPVFAGICRDPHRVAAAYSPPLLQAA